MAEKCWSMFVYPWDLHDEGIRHALERINQMGITRILIAVSYHSGKFFLPHNPQKKIYYHDSGRVYFSPNLSQYGVLKPLTGDAFQQFCNQGNEGSENDLLRVILDTAHSLHMEVYAWTVGFHNSRLGLQFPEVTVRNVYGESYRHALCPSNREARHYVYQMITDLVQGYQLDGIVLESFDYLGMFHGDHHEIAAVADPDNLEKLIGLCFCNGCRRSAEKLGIDVERFMTHVRTAINQIGNSFERVDHMSIDDMERYLTMRAQTVERVYRQVKQIVLNSGKPVTTYSTLWLANGADPEFYGIIPARINAYLDGWIACYPQSVAQVPDFLRKARGLIEEQKLSSGIRMIAPETVSPEQIQGYIAMYQEEDMNKLVFYNYGLASNAVLGQIK